MKKFIIAILLLLFVTVGYSQTKIGTITLRDSSGVLVISAPINLKTLNPWIKNQWFNPVSTNSGLAWDSVNGLSLKLGVGLTISNDTLKYNGTSVVTIDDTTLQYVNGVLSARVNNGLTKDLNGLSLKLNSTNLEFDGSGNLQVKANSITESQISKDINFDSIKIGDVKMSSLGGKVFSDSLVNGLIYSTQIYFPATADYTTYDLLIASDVNGNPTFSTSVGDYFNFKKPIQIYTGDLTLLNGRIQGHKGDSVSSASDITLSQGNFFIITGTTGIRRINTTDWQAGSTVILLFRDGLTLTHAQTVSGSNYGMFLAGAADYIVSANDIITLVFDGEFWRETSRTDN